MTGSLEQRTEILVANAVFDPSHSDTSRAALVALEQKTAHGQTAVRVFLLALDLHTQDITGHLSEQVAKAMAARVVRIRMMVPLVLR